VARSQPGQQALARFRESVYGDHPYGRVFPSDESLSALTLEQVKAFHQAGFAAARAHLYVAGRFDAAAAEQAVRTAFGRWKRGTPAAPKRPAPMAARVLHTVDRPGAVQSTIYMGLPVIDVSDPSYVPLLVTHTLLGGYFSSRITSNIREQKGYTYSPQAQISRRRRDAYWAEQADVTTAVTGASLKEIFFEIERLRSEAPPAQELEAVKSYLSGTFVLQNSTRNGIIDQLQLVDLNGLPEPYLRELVPRIQAVTPNDVKEMARSHIVPERITVVVVGDLKAIDEQLNPYR
jgi:predicted Zn-dependent peptidase